MQHERVRITGNNSDAAAIHFPNPLCYKMVQSGDSVGVCVCVCVCVRTCRKALEYVHSLNILHCLSLVYACVCCPSLSSSIC